MLVDVLITIVVSLLGALGLVALIFAFAWVMSKFDDDNDIDDDYRGGIE